MSEAVIIPFPSQDTAPALSEQDRLRRALVQLEAAMADQRAALQEWRFAMAELGIGVAGMSQALSCYQSSLLELQDGVGSLRSEARKLEEWADKALAAAPQV